MKSAEVGLFARSPQISQEEINKDNGETTETSSDEVQTNDSGTTGNRILSNKDLWKYTLGLQTDVLELQVKKEEYFSEFPGEKNSEEDLVSEFEKEVFLAVFKEVCIV
ncbi:hypothetical protein CEXT_783731 [Caerostris extrusa]|uniref:Uncharacterized protein n=1 Tax=Caerostris extrusa TaxID=172846 RepID=A0AAV4R476_CAEEX|nr:hypothetical protein CEXT_783731 [Caerostris extrusa]